jgi:hypothetical protein
VIDALAAIICIITYLCTVPPVAWGQTLLDTLAVRGDAHGDKLSAELTRWEARSSRRQLWARLRHNGCNEAARDTLPIVPFFAAMAGMRDHAYVCRAVPLVMMLDVNSILTYAAIIAARGTSACNFSWTSLARLLFLPHRPYGLGKSQKDVWNLPINSRINYGGLTCQESLTISTSHSC